MKSVSNAILLSCCVLLAAGESVTVSPLMAANEPARITSNVDVKPEGTLTRQEEESLSLAAGKLLGHVDHARADLKSNNTTAAKQEVEKALTLGKIIKSAMPTYVITTLLKAGQLQYNDQSRLQPLLVTLHDELNVEAVMAPVRAAKREAAKKQAVSDGQVFQDVKLHESRARLDVGLAMIGLERAKKALADNKIQTANDALSTIQTGVLMEYVVADLPLERVQANLVIARQAINDKRFAQAKAALQIAQDSLLVYEKSVGANRAKESAALRADIEKLSASIQQQEPKEAQDRISTWWNTVTHWFK